MAGPTSTSASPSLTRRLPSASSPFSSPSSSAILSASSGTLPPRPRSLYSHAARAFLQRDYLNALLTSQEVLELLKTEEVAGADGAAPEDPASSTSSLLPGSDDLVTKTLILRLTLLSTIYCTPATRTQVQGTLLSSTHTSASTASSRLAVDPQAFAAQAWQEVLTAYAGPAPPPVLLERATLEPVPETLPLALNVPAKVLASVVMATLRLDEVDAKADTSSSAGSAGSGTGCRSARSICEWFLAAHSSSQENDNAGVSASASTLSKQHLQESYARVMELYTLHVLGARAGEWDYASEIVRYSQLEMGEAESLLARLAHARNEMLERPERARLASEAAKEAYEAERSRRAEAAVAAADEEVAAKEAASAKGHAEPVATPLSTSAVPTDEHALDARPELTRSTSTSSSSTSASGTSASHRRARKSSSTSNTSNSSKGGGDSNARIQSTSTTARRSSSASRKERERDAEQSAAASSPSEQDDYAAARSSVSRFVEKSHRRDEERAARPSSSGSLIPRNSYGGPVPASRPAASQAHQLLDTLRAIVPHQLHFLLGAFPALVGAIVVALLVWRRTTARAEGRNAGPRGAESDAARRVRAQLQGSATRGGGPLGWAAGAVGKLWDTVRMGTQVTYL